MNVLGWALAFFVGLLSLSQEILWVRLATFLNYGVPQSFAFVLGLFLFGIAAGATLGKRLCMHCRAVDVAGGTCLLAGGLIDFLVPYIIARAAEANLSSVALGTMIYLSASMKATAFPIAHHLASNSGEERLGRSLARVYALNIAGSTLGSLLTGYVLLEYVSVAGGFCLVGAGTLGIGALALLRAYPLAGALVGIVAVSVLAGSDFQDHSLIARIGTHGEDPMGAIVENRHGVIHVASNGDKGDTVYGGNVYDGRTNIDLKINSNRVDRVYLLASLHPSPRRVLVIGLGSGAWARILSALPGMERMDVVEINPGYLSLIPQYPQLSPILDDSRIRIQVDDGRRWLRRHPEAKFDLIVMNTSFHWRANSTNLLSQEFLTLTRSHLLPGGIIAFNATGSADALATAAAVFPFAYRWSNFIYAGDSDFRDVSQEQALARLAALRLEGRAVFDPGRATDRAVLLHLVETPFVSRSEAEAETGRPLEVISDVNMITEFKFGRSMAP